MSIGTGVIVAIAFEQVDSAPDTKTGTESDDERLQYADCTVEKCHKVFPPFLLRLRRVIMKKPSSCSACAPMPQEKGMKKARTLSKRLAM